MDTGRDDPWRVLRVVVDVLAPRFEVGPLGVRTDLVIGEIDVAGVASSVHLDLDDIEPEQR